MGRSPCCEKMGLKKGPWTPEEDQILINFISLHGHPNWRALPKQAGLLRCGKSCRLRWTNYLRPDIKLGNFTLEEEEIIINLHEQLGNRWSVIAARLPGRTDNEIKNVWHTHLKKRLPQSNETMTESVTGEANKKRGRKSKKAKNDNISMAPKIECVNCMQQEDEKSNKGDNEHTSSVGPIISANIMGQQPCTSTSSEISSVTSASEINYCHESNGDVGDDFGHLLQTDNDFWMDVLPYIEHDTVTRALQAFPVTSEPDSNISPDLKMMESPLLELDTEAHENDMDHFWYHLLIRSNELTELSQVL